jgi:hypothetical protein
MSDWTDLIQKIYNEKHAKNKTYKYKKAMKDAMKVYNKDKKRRTEKKQGQTEKKRGKTEKKRGKTYKNEKKR